MALNGVTNPEKLIIPLFFNKKERGDLARLFRPDSVLKHLMDEWKEDTVSSSMKEELNLIKYLRSRISLLKSPKFSLIKHLDASFKKRVQALVSAPDAFFIRLEDHFSKQLNALDNDFLAIILQYYAILEEHKRLASLKSEHIKIALDLKKEIEIFSKRMKLFATMLEYETWGAVSLVRLEETSSQYNRCEKAIYDNIRTDFFAGSDYSGLKLMQAYKIENSISLKHFENRVKEEPDSMVKGMFISLRKKHLITAALFGIKSHDFIQNSAQAEYRRLYYRLPKVLTDKSNVEGFLKNCEGIKSGLWGSTFSTLEKDREKLQAKENCVLYLVLSRVVLSKSKNQTNFNFQTQEYPLAKFENVYPEYILVCVKEKSRYEVVPEAHTIIPVKLCDLDYSNHAKSNVMPPYAFYAQVNRALDNSHAKRVAQKTKVQEIVDRTLHSRPGFNAEDLRKPVVHLLQKAKAKLEKQVQEAKHDTVNVTRQFKTSS